MNSILWLIAGGLIGWVANVTMRPDTQRAAVFNLWAGIVGATLGGWFLNLLVGVSSISESGFSVTSLLASLLGAVTLLAIMNLVHRGLTRF
jgi:uncharacterized membrane protein YeaQ/YmgE (transglycosylase-associated protein family)